MDWRRRKYYYVNFCVSARDMRLEFLKLIDEIKIHPYKNIPKQPDETEKRGYYQFLLSVPFNCAKTLEYELKKAERRDDYCIWKEIKRDISKKYFDVFGFEMPYRRCDLNPRKRCNH